MNKTRLEAFSDGVLAIIITIMVLELRPPEEISLAALQALLPNFLSYALSFLFLGIYWNNHHHLFQAARRVNGAILWANLHLLFWLSLIPFVTAWIGRNPNEPLAAALYGVDLVLAAGAYYLLSRVLVARQGAGSPLARALGNDSKGKVSMIVYAAAIPLAYVNPLGSYALYLVVALMWLVPDRRIEKVIDETKRLEGREEDL